MPSHLTRHVIRCLISNEPIVYRGCIRRQAYSSLSRWHRNSNTQRPRHLGRRAALQTSSRRTFFDFGFGQNKKVLYDDPALAPGVELMQSLMKRQRLRARLLPVEEVEQALNAFLKYMDKFPDRPLPDTQAALVLNAVRFIDHDRGLSMKDVDETAIKERNVQVSYRNLKITKILRRDSKHDTAVHLELARYLYSQAQQPGVPRSGYWFSYKVLLLKLCNLGHALEARDLWSDEMKFASSEAGVSDEFDLMQEKIQDSKEVVQRGKKHTILLLEVLNALAREGYEAELLQLIDIMKQTRLDYNLGLIDGVVVTFYAKRNDITKVKKWYDVWLSHLRERIPRVDGSPEYVADVTRAISQCCLRTGDIELGHTYLKQISEVSGHKAVYDEVLAWNLAVHKSTEQIDSMLDLMKQNSNKVRSQPNTDTINRLIEVAIEQNNPYMAEKIINIGRERRIHPDARTLTLQLDYRLSVDDVDGALTSYQHLVMQDLSKNEDVPSVNRLIVALCSSKRHDFETIMNVAADLSDRRVGFEPLTVEKLCILHLRRDEMADVEDLLKTHASSFTSEERKSLRGAILEFCIDSKTPVANTWDAYNLLRNSFDEMPREERVEIIQALFEKRRPDMVAHVFAHMRQHSRQDTVPDVEAYISTILGCARSRDQETLEVIHNQLKLDTNIDVSTRLRNALMIAHSSCFNSGMGMSIWDDIVASREGPTYNSLIIALQICESISWGDVKAQQIWSRLRKNKVVLDKKLWTSYLAALAANGNIETAVATVEDAARRKELEVDETVIAALWRASTRERKHNEIASWAQENFPQIWESLQQIEESTTDMQVRKKKLNAIDLHREIAP